MLQKIKNSRFFVNYKRMWPFVKPYWFRSLVAILITIPIGALDSVIALALKPFMDTVIMDKGGSTPFNLPLYVIPLFIVIFTIIQSLLEYSAAYLNTWTGGKITMELQKKLYRKLLSIDQSYLDSTSSGTVLMRFNGDAGTACAGLLNNLKVFTTRVFLSLIHI